MAARSSSGSAWCCRAIASDCSKHVSAAATLALPRASLSNRFRETTELGLVHALARRFGKRERFVEGLKPLILPRARAH